MPNRIGQRILNGFEIRLFGRYFRLNAYGFGFGVLSNLARQHAFYRVGWKLCRGR